MLQSELTCAEWKRGHRFHSRYRLDGCRHRPAADDCQSDSSGCHATTDGGSDEERHGSGDCRPTIERLVDADRHGDAASEERHRLDSPHERQFEDVGRDRSEQAGDAPAQSREAAESVHDETVLLEEEGAVEHEYEQHYGHSGHHSCSDARRAIEAVSFVEHSHSSRPHEEQEGCCGQGCVKRHHVPLRIRSTHSVKVRRASQVSTVYLI